MIVFPLQATQMVQITFFLKQKWDAGKYCYSKNVQMATMMTLVVVPW